VSKLFNNRYELSDVCVNKERWTYVPDLSNSGPEERVYLVDDDPAGGAWVRFGDGTHGKRPPPDSSVIATWRAGSTEVRVALTRAASIPTQDQELWVAIRNRTDTLSFGYYDRAPAASANHSPSIQKRTLLCILAFLLVILLLIVLLFAVVSKL